jgi:hypothetical protein
MQFHHQSTRRDFLKTVCAGAASFSALGAFAAEEEAPLTGIANSTSYTESFSSLKIADPSHLSR